MTATYDSAEIFQNEYGGCGGRGGGAIACSLLRRIMVARKFPSRCSCTRSVRTCVAIWRVLSQPLRSWDTKASSLPDSTTSRRKDIRKMLDDNGLQAVGCHTALNTLQGEEFDKTVEFNKIIGNPRLVVPSLAANYTNSRMSIEGAADIFNGIAAKLKPLGMRTGFHCHPGEFRQVEGATVWDTFFTRANRDVIMQCDLGHMGTADADQVAYISKYPGRSATVHVKPAHAAPLLGDTPDTNKWPEIFKACESVGGTEWYIVEYDGGSMDKVVRTMDVLKKWGKV